jgi:hypothetical protein
MAYVVAGKGQAFYRAEEAIGAFCLEEMGKDLVVLVVIIAAVNDQVFLVRDAGIMEGIHISLHTEVPDGDAFIDHQESDLPAPRFYQVAGGGEAAFIVVCRYFWYVYIIVYPIEENEWDLFIAGFGEVAMVVGFA